MAYHKKRNHLSMNRLNIVADDKIPFLRGVLEPYASIRYLPARDIIRKEISDADALIIRTRTECNRNLLEGTSVQFIASATIGYDHFDTSYCHEKKITWTNAPGCNASSVKQYIASALVYLSRQFRFTLEGKTLGIIGVGNVGTRVESLGHALGMKVLLNDPPRARREGDEQFVNLSAILEQSDIITLHVPLNLSGIDKTYRMADATFLGKMKKGSFLINTSRGKTVDETALKEALKSRHLKGIVLDVWDNEPHLDPDLLSMTSIGTPHIAGYSQDGKANGTSAAVQSLSRYFNLDLHNWYPENIPEPVNPVITISGKKNDSEAILGEAVLASYPIADDHRRLVGSPDRFEELRGNYPVRREFPSYTIKLLSGDNMMGKRLKAIGFNIKMK